MKSLLIMFTVLVLYACSYAVNVRPPISQPPAVEKKPLTVGVFYPEDLKNYNCSASKGYIAESWEIHLGPSSVETFDLILSSLFENIVKVDSVTSAVNNGLKNVIEVRLKNYNGCEVSWPIFGSTILIEYEAALYNNDATVITTWKGSGRSMPSDSQGGCGTVDFSYDLFESKYLAIATCIAMRMAAADFIVNFQKDLKIRAYLGK